MPELFGLSLRDREAIQHVFRGHPAIEKGLVYASRAKGNYKHGSDIDLSLIAPSMTLKIALKTKPQN